MTSKENSNTLGHGHNHNHNHNHAHGHGHEHGPTHGHTAERLPEGSVFNRAADRLTGEMRCQRAQIDESISIRNLKRYCSDKVATDPTVPRPVQPRLPSNGKKIAVVGGGPSGLAAAYFLARFGYKVTIFEEAPMLGGLLRYGIPPFRLPPHVIDAEIKDILDLGVEARRGVRVGKDIMIEELRKQFDAVYIAVGTQKDKTLGLEGEDMPGMFPGLELLKKLNAGEKVALGKKVLVIGGGNVAIDVARSVVRLGASEVTICYRREEEDMTAYMEEVIEAKQENIRFNFLVAPEKIIAEGGRAVGMLFRKMKIGEYAKNGRREILPTDETVEMRADAIVTAIGQELDTEFAAGAEKSIISTRNLVIADTFTFQTPVDKMYAGGDAVMGPWSVIRAVGQGKNAARSIDKALTGRDSYIELKKMSPIVVTKEEPKDNLKNLCREHPEELKVAERCTNFHEVVLCFKDECARKEANRCLRCDIREVNE